MRGTRSHLVRSGLLALVITLVAAACGGSSTSSSGSGPGGAADLSQVDPNGTLRYGAANEPTRFDPHRSSNGYDQNWLAPVYERLMHQTPKVELKPALALTWGFTDERTFELTLRQGVKFTDGTPFDGEAVKANINRAKTVEGSGVKAYLASVDTVEVLAPDKVRFRLNKPDATLPMQLATRPGMMLSPAAFTKPDLDTNPVGTGPFKLASYKRGDRGVYERNPDAWNKDYAKVQRLEILYMPDSSTRLNALRSGQIDATPIDASQLNEARRTPDVNVSVSDAIDMLHFQLDRAKSHFGELKVRRAMNHAIDREAIVQALLFGQGTPTQQWVPEGTPYHNSAYPADHYKYDPALAKRLLAEAGLPNGFTFTAMVSVQPLYVRLGEILKEQFAQVGITMDLRQEPQLADAFFTRRAADAIVSAYPGRIDPAETTQIYFNDESFSNPGRHVTPEVKALWFESLKPADEATRTKALQALGGRITEDALGVPIAFPKALLATKSNVVGLQYWLSGHIEFQGVGVKGK